MYDPNTHLTFSAMTGQRKQSIRDVEVLLSEDVEKFMGSKKYMYEAKYVRAVRHWRLASDQRGLSQLERCRYNYELLNLVVTEMMPWFEENYNFSTLEVTRYVYANTIIMQAYIHSICVIL